MQDIIRKMAVTDRLWEENARQVRSIGGDVLLGRWACSELDGKETAGEGAAAPSPEKCLNPWDFSLQSVSYLLNYTLCI